MEHLFRWRSRRSGTATFNHLFSLTFLCLAAREPAAVGASVSVALGISPLAAGVA
jgi:hypothetical protein